MFGVLHGMPKNLSLFDDVIQSIVLDTVYSISSIRVITSMTPVGSHRPPMAGNELANGFVGSFIQVMKISSIVASLKVARYGYVNWLAHLTELEACQRRPRVCKLVVYTVIFHGPVTMTPRSL